MNNLNNIALICEIINHLKEGKTTRVEEDCDPSAFAKGILMYLEESTDIFTPESINRFLDSLIDYYKSELERTITHLNSVYGLFPNSFNPGPGIRELPYMPGGWTPGDITCGITDTNPVNFNGVLPDGVPKTPLYTSAIYGTGRGLMKSFGTSGTFKQYNAEKKPEFNFAECVGAGNIYAGATLNNKEFARFCCEVRNLGRLPIDEEEYECMKDKWLKIHPEDEKSLYRTDILMRMNGEEPPTQLENTGATSIAEVIQANTEKHIKEKDEKILESIKTLGFGTKYTRAALQHKGLTETAMKLYRRLPVDYDEYTETINNYIADNRGISEKDLVKNIVDPDWIKDVHDNWNPETDSYRCMSYPTETEDLLEKVKTEGVSTKYTRATLKHKGLTETALNMYNRLPVDYNEYYRVYYCYTSQHCVATDEKIYEPEWLKDQPESWGIMSEEEEKAISQQMINGMKQGIESVEKTISIVEQLTPDEQRGYIRKMDAVGVNYSKQDSITK